ncbi:hypothetical protein BYI23_D001690 (plasmid) [Burkholderia sp. YI23]|nr:hypothetical protein BYI23_D001690 [Burkholderia sp. YI23]
MIFVNETTCPASWTVGYQRDGRERLIVVVKGTFTLPENGKPTVLAPQQQALVEADQFIGEPGYSAPLRETDYAHCKTACDVLLLGSAHAPGQRAALRVQVGLQVGTMTKRFDVTGPRVWHRRLGTSVMAASAPAAFERLPIHYGTAFGGVDRSEEKRTGRVDTFLPNPAGRGFARHPASLDGQLLPFTSEHGKPVTQAQARYTPMAFSPIGRNWLPRSRFAGTYDQQWIDNTAPCWPDDFDDRYFQAAPPDQIIAFPCAPLDVRLSNLTPDGDRRFTIPHRPMPVTFIPYQGRDVERDALLDTIVLEPDEARYTLTWRSVLPLGKSIFDVREVIVGERSRAARMTRRFAGKPWYPSLADAVRALDRRRGSRS